MPFAIVKKGYDPKAVDEYINLQQQEHLDQMETAKDRQRMLSEEIEDLKNELAELKQNETRLVRLLSDLKTLADNVRAVTTAYRDEEMARLAAFRDKWVDYATTYLHQNLGDFADKLDEFAYEYARDLQRDLNENLFVMADPLWADYRAETDRTADFSQAPVYIDELLQKLQQKK